MQIGRSTNVAKRIQRERERERKKIKGNNNERKKENDPPQLQKCLRETGKKEKERENKENDSRKK